jgi:hypothetical protein
MKFAVGDDFFEKGEVMTMNHAASENKITNPLRHGK